MTVQGSDDRRPTAVAPAPVEGAITSVAAGFVSGWVSSAYGKRRLALLVGRRRLASTQPRASDEAARADFLFDARHIPVDLLVGETLALEVVLLGERSAPFAAITVAASDFVKMEDLSAAAVAGDLEGCIDERNDRVVRGWVHDKARPERQLDLFVFAGDRYLGKYLATQSRPDLAASGRGHGCYGFEIHFPESPSSDVAVIAGDPEYWRVPVGAHARLQLASPRRLPSPRDLPDTVEHFARLLASTEPFPKKTFVLDKLKGGSVPDAFASDYVLLALECLRHEMVATGEAMQGGWRDRLRTWAEMRIMGTRIRRLEELAATIAAGPRLLESAARRRESDLRSSDRRESERPKTGPA